MSAKDKIEIIELDEDTPTYEGYSEIARFGNRFFRTRDAEGYSSWLEEIDEKEYIRLQKYKYKGGERRSPAGYAEKDIDEIVNKTCSLVPEQMRNMTKEEIKKEEEYEKEKYDVCSLIPAGEVIATGSVDQITDKIESYLNNYLTLECELPRTIIRATIQGLIGLDQCNKGTLIWVPDKEVK